MSRSPLSHSAVASVFLALAGCTHPVVREEQRAQPSPYVLVLGTAQDAGLPQIGCNEGNCAAARVDPGRRRLVTSLMLCDPRDGRRWLFDCTPDIEEQIERARGHPETRGQEGPRPPLVDGLFLTHAHMGHYGGLLELGPEAYSARKVTTWVSARFAGFLRTNAPWSLLVEGRHLLLCEFVPGARIELAPDLFVVPFLVPHRDEFSDTVGFEIHGPNRTLVYLPDIDKWSALDAFEASAGEATGGRIEERIESCDLAFLDGAFFADGEIPGRGMKDIPHPFISESIERFGPLPAEQRNKIFFTHLNHTNPVADGTSTARSTVRASGMHVLEEGQLFDL